MSILFIADLHLEDERPDLNRAFCYFCEKYAATAESLYILGDFFNAWVGDDNNSQTADIVSHALKQLSYKGVSVYIQHGNRDFLIGEKFAARCNATLLPEEYLINPYGKPLLLMHGDQLCTDDSEYQSFRAMVRSTEWQTAFLAKPLQERLNIAAELRKTSREASRMKSSEIMDVNPSSVNQIMAKHHVDLLIHGHTHRPAIHTIEAHHFKNQNVKSHDVELQSISGDNHSNSNTRIVLGDWDSHYWFLELKPNNQFLLIDRPITET